mgnify:CR=1 FL=1
MIIVKPSYKILTEIDGKKELQHIEKIARVCYKSEDKIDQSGESAKKIVGALLLRGHEAMIEHSSLSVKFIIDRGITHELVRHRIASFAQESTRYCNYSGDKFSNQITVIEPYFYKKNPTKYEIWKKAMEEAENAYFALIKAGSTPQEARSVLPNSLKTEITITANYREWRNIFKLRCAPDAHPQCREILIPLLKELQSKIPLIFDGIKIGEIN